MVLIDNVLFRYIVVATCNLLSALSRCDHARRLLISAELPAGESL